MHSHLALPCGPAWDRRWPVPGAPPPCGIYGRGVQGGPPQGSCAPAGGGPFGMGQKAGALLPGSGPPPVWGPDQPQPTTAVMHPAAVEILAGGDMKEARTLRPVSGGLLGRLAPLPGPCSCVTLPLRPHECTAPPPPMPSEVGPKSRCREPRTTRTGCPRGRA